VLSPRAQVAVAAGFGLLVLATIVLAVVVLTGLVGSAGEPAPEARPAAASTTPPTGPVPGGREACTALAEALAPVVPLLTPAAPQQDDPVRGQAVSTFLLETGDLELSGWFARWPLVLSTDMGLLAFQADSETYAQRYADYGRDLAELADACAVQGVTIPPVATP
jgi:hypothetical protein